MTTAKLRALAVHLYTASGLLMAALATRAILDDRFQAALAWLVAACVVDATDGTLARRYRVKKVLPGIDGRRMDDIIDYLTYTFLPLVLMAKAGWLPEPAFLWVSIPMIASVFAFANVGAKEEEGGFFVGFPSYWNALAIYALVGLKDLGSVVLLSVVLALSLLSVLPVRFVYPSLAPRWRGFFLLGGAAWGILLLLLLFLYPAAPPALVLVSLLYPAAYFVLSIYLDVKSRRAARSGPAGNRRA